MLKVLLLIPVYIIRRWGIYIFLIGGLSFLLLLVHRKIYNYYSTNPQYQIDLNNLQATALPDWVTDRTIEQSIRHDLQIDEISNINDQKTITRILEEYEKSPWVAKVHAIEKRFPNNLKIKLEIREPVVAVQLKKWNNTEVYYLIDKNMVRLPGEYRSVPLLPMTIPVIVGVRVSPPPPGSEWNDQGLKGALAVAAALEKNSIHDIVKIDHIEIARQQTGSGDSGSNIVIWTKNKVPIQWGRSPYVTKMGELSLEKKINNLKLVLKVSPELKGVKYVKIQFHQPYIALKK
ncbi:MAG: hypothetical protein KAS70_04190 [Planctomycetes bacterium]|nr:hypothetical protein [Planctomycetota bacterium]